MNKSELTNKQLLDLHTKASMSLVSPAAYSMFGNEIAEHHRKIEDELLKRLEAYAPGSTSYLRHRVGAGRAPNNDK